jgi:DNA-binding NarL/FixJ family response regulator
VSISVLLADDQPLLRRGFRMILEAEGDIAVAAEAGNGEEAAELARRHAPDIVLMDIRMPGTDGIEATRRITAADARVRVLVLTTFDLDEYAFGALRAGASGFLLKDVRPAELVTAIRTVAAGDAVISPRVTRRLLEEYAQVLPLSAGQKAQRYPKLAMLTERERAVRLRGDREVPRGAHPRQAGAARPGPGRRARLRSRPDPARGWCRRILRGGDGNRTRVQGFAGPCLSHSATPPQGHTGPSRADDGIRTRDPHLGKVMLYQLSHVRIAPQGVR